ncbi:hypothetical protein CRM22_006991 [Opisthorchis felineus]|uniref:Fibronectin type-III domain-containing protein n=1 Tax=Opisthorchis felineus TaxID=147828 RepID=A0A4S2LK95_OPIFE|nr:hypothetical protein CRM22_006991 [Opisthorchis felineus]
MDITVSVLPGQPQANVSWATPTSDIDSKFTVNLYNGSTAVQSRKTDQSHILFQNVALCVSWTVGIVAENEHGSSPEEFSREFRIPAMPKPPEALQVKTVTSETNAVVSWDYKGECPTSSFQVSAHKEDGTSLGSVSTTDRNVQLSDLPLCTSLYVGVVAQNGAGSGPQTKTIPLTIPAAPGELTAVKVKAEPSVTNATVSWEYTHACVADQFKVILYSPYGAILNTVLTSGREVNLFNLSVNVPLYVGVLGINTVGTGPEKKSRNFIISHGLTAELRRPQPEAKLEVQLIKTTLEDSINVTVSTHRGRSFVDVSWVVRISHNISKFTVNLYNVSSMVQSQTTDRNSTTFWYVDPCLSWTVGISAQHEEWTSQEWFSKQFRIPAAKAPEPPSNMTWQLNRWKRMLTVSWMHSCATSFEVFFYSEVHLTGRQTTQNRTVTFGNLPVDLPLRVGVTAQNDYGASMEALSVEFFIPTYRGHIRSPKRRKRQRKLSGQQQPSTGTWDILKGLLQALF